MRSEVYAPTHGVLNRPQSATVNFENTRRGHGTADPARPAPQPPLGQNVLLCLASVLE